MTLLCNLLFPLFIRARAADAKVFRSPDGLKSPKFDRHEMVGRRCCHVQAVQSSRDNKLRVTVT